VNTETLVSAGDQHISLSTGALAYLVRHSFRERIFEFKPPYENEAADFGTELPALIALALSVGWFVRSDAKDVVSHWAKLDDLKAALAAAGIPAKGKRDELLAACLLQCPEWVANFSKKRPGYRPTDKGIIELQATRPEVIPWSKEIHLRQMREYFDRDLNDARRSPGIIIGIKVYARTDNYWADQPCPKAAKFAGVYLPDEVPELYPVDCPMEDACCCVLREMVLCDDKNEEGKMLRARTLERGMPALPPPRDYEKELAEVEAMEQKKFAGNPEGKAKHFEMMRKIIDTILRR